MNLRRHHFLGFPLVTSSAKEVSEALANEITRASRPPIVVNCLNPHSIAVSEFDGPFRDALRNTDVLLPDGIGVVLAARIAGASVTERIPGYALFERMLEINRKTGNTRTYFFVGSSPETLNRVRAAVEARSPCSRVVGTYAPTFFDREMPLSEQDEITALVNAAKPDVLWVGMTAPKQELWISANAERLNCSMVAGVGAVFDFLAGTKKRAPRSVQRLGLEWLYRLLLEPSRMWRRTFVSGLVFCRVLAWDAASRLREKSKGIHR